MEKKLTLESTTLPPKTAMLKAEGVPSLQDMIALRTGPNQGRAYAFYCFHFLPCVLGRKNWVEGLRRGYEWKKFVSLSDEAYGLLVLENLWDQWQWEFGNPDATKSDKRIKGGGPVYSTGIGKEAKLMKGWSKEGVVRLNALMELVRMDRTDIEAANPGETEAARVAWEGFMKQFLELIPEWDPDDLLKITAAAESRITEEGEEEEMPDCTIEL